VGRPLEEAVFAEPNCAQVFHTKLPSYGTKVEMGPPLDGVAPHMADYPEEQAFRSWGTTSSRRWARLPASARLRLAARPFGACTSGVRA
jgi:myo-inositol-1-phosphate synthase